MAGWPVYLEMVIYGLVWIGESMLSAPEDVFTLNWGCLGAWYM
jgi:hypothetical protein